MIVTSRKNLACCALVPWVGTDMFKRSINFIRFAEVATSAPTNVCPNKSKYLDPVVVKSIDITNGEPVTLRTYNVLSAYGPVYAFDTWQTTSLIKACERKFTLVAVPPISKLSLLMLRTAVCGFKFPRLNGYEDAAANRFPATIELLLTHTFL